MQGGGQGDGGKGCEGEGEAGGEVRRLLYCLKRQIDSACTEVNLGIFLYA